MALESDCRPEMVFIWVEWWMSSMSLEGSLAVSEARESALPCCKFAKTQTLV